MEQADFGEEEIRAVVRSAYQRKEAPEGAVEGGKVSQSLNVSLSATNAGNEDDFEAEKQRGEMLRERTPTFKEEVYEQIPDFFRECVKYASNTRERDGLLLSCITTVSAMLPTVTTFYNKHRCWSNLYCVVIAPSGNSKGIFSYGSKLIKHYQEYWKQQNEQKEKAHAEELKKHEALCKEAQRKRVAVTEARPVEPSLQFPYVPSDTSKSRLIMHLKDNITCGTLLFETEADTLTSANKQDYGDFNDILRKAYHHESISCSFKVNNKPMYVYAPAMSVFLTGTPNQLVNFTPTMENGMFSRLLCYTFRQTPQWQDVLSEEKNDMEECFDHLSMRLLHIALFLKESPTHIRLTELQRGRFNRRFSQLLTESDLHEHDNMQGVVKRYGLMVVRLCMIFTAIDKGTLRMDVKEMFCPDRYFEAAMSVIECCLEHSQLLSTSLTESKEVQQELTVPDKFGYILSMLPHTFTTAEMLHIARTLDVSRATLWRMAKKAIGLKINKIAHGVFEKSS